MAYPTWLTPAGNLGIVPEQEYYQFQLDAYDTAAGTLQFIKLSGTLPPGLQISTTGTIQGIPISTAGADLNQTYTFTVRIKNLSDNLISDRTFSLTITNVAPPVIIPRDVNLGKFFDGDVVSIQLEAVEFIVEDTLTWSVKSGNLPPGVTLSTNGLLSGYIQLIPAVGPTSDPGWDDSEWDERFTVSNVTSNLGWDFPLGTTSKYFDFIIEVSDGARSDISTYQMYVIPKTSLTADSTVLTVDTTTVDGDRLTVDTGDRHAPVILTTQTDLPPERQGSWFTYQLQAVDLDGDVLQYTIPSLSQGSFDEQTLIGNGIPYLGRSIVSDGNIFVGGMSTADLTRPAIQPGDEIQVLQPYTDISSELTTYLWYDADVNNHTTIRVTGNTLIQATAGNFITQSIDGANATITNISVNTGTITVGGGPIVGVIATFGNLITANVGDFITQASSGANATITAAAALSTLLNIRINSGIFAVGSGNLKLNGANVDAYPSSVSTAVSPTTVTANVGDIISQASTGANAIVLAFHNSFNGNTVNPSIFQVRYIANSFSTGATSGNISINGSNVAAYPSTVVYNADISAIYNTSDLFRLNATDPTAMAYIANVATNAFPTSVISVGVDANVSPSSQGTLGFDETKFDQGALTLPGTLSVNINSGWITGFLPVQTANSTEYEFEVVVYKRDYANYVTSKLLTITVLGNLNNRVDWLTPSYIGSIENGAVSDLSLTAISTENKQLYYYFTPGSYINMPQGLTLQPDGLIGGRVSFELFSLDSGTTTFDSDIITGDPTTTFDHTFEFTVTARTFDQSASTDKHFTILVRERNIKPYENLYLKALLNRFQRLELNNLLQNQSVFPADLIYRSTDPWFGIARDVKTLFLPGLNPSSVADYINAISTNHFTKRLLFTEVKTAVAKADGIYDVIDNTTEQLIGTYNVNTTTFVPTDFSLGYTVSSSIPGGTRIGDQHIKYEVVYAEIKDQNTNAAGQGPADVINLNGVIQNPYYNTAGNTFVIANPNAFNNMDDAVINNIGYLNKGALPDWMTSIQPNGVQLGFTRAVVLAYTVPGASETIAWRFNQLGYDLNELNFVVDRYLLDNVYTGNYDLTANAFVTSRETTFDRYPALPSSFRRIGTVDYAVNTAFQDINARDINELIDAGGFDGVTSFKDGETVVFFQQEFPTGLDIGDVYNQGWTNVVAPWDDPDVFDADWDHDGSQGWDQAKYVPGYTEWLQSRQVINGNPAYTSPNQRIGIWRITVESDGFVRLTLANTVATITGVTANSTGYGSNVRVSTTANVFVGMPVRGTGIANTSVITDIIGSNVVIYPAVTATISSTITFIPTPTYNDVVYVRNGLTHGGVNIYYDPYVKADNIVPNYSKLPQQIKTSGTIFDGDGTKFYDNRDSYVIPEQGDKFIRFPRLNVFD